MKKAVAVLLFDQGMILGVSRRDNPNDFGLVGGKLDDGETFEAAAIRETKEETGLDIFGLHKVFERMDDDFMVVTFAAQWKGRISPPASETGVVKWVTWDELKSGSFGKYNVWLETTLKENKFY
jgi:8-oxo-dGTP pyrophosphatase MutT (NUDIX family)